MTLTRFLLLHWSQDWTTLWAYSLPIYSVMDQRQCLLFHYLVKVEYDKIIMLACTDKLTLFTAPLYSPELKVVAVNSSSIRVTWELVNCFNSSGDPPEYHLTVVKINGDFSESIIKPKFSTEHYFTQLEEHAQYKVSISAVNIFNESQTCSDCNSDYT